MPFKARSITCRYCMFLFCTFLVSSIVQFALSFSAFAQSEGREKIGLVLAGGGALGMAHVGVLKVIEEQRIPISFIAGTSMGAIVGGAYATGLTVVEMERILKDSDWEQIFSDGVERNELPFRSKAGQNREIYGDAKLSLEDGKLVTPFGVVQGQRLLPVLQRLYSNAPPSPADFNKFRIPLRVVAADIENGQAVVISRGDLPSAVRASMSVPGVFAPVEIDGRLLVDGGVVNNLPIDVVREMGATRLIVVELNAELKKKEDLRNPLSTAGQIISLLLAQNSSIQKATLTSRDVLIEPDLKGYSAVDFNKAKELIKLGERAARGAIAQLQGMEISQAGYQSFRSKREMPVPPPLIEFISVESDKLGADPQIKETFNSVIGARLDRSDLDQRVEQIYNSGQYVSVRYDIVEQDGKAGVKISAQRKRWLDDYFRFGASLQDDFQGETNYNIGGAYRINEVTSQGGWLQGEAVIGFSPKLSATLVQPIYDGSPLFIAPRLEYSRQSVFPMVNQDIVAQYEREQYLAAFGVGGELGRSGELLVEYRAADSSIKRHIGAPDLPEKSYQVGEAALVWNIDTADNPDFPTEGFVSKVQIIESSQTIGASDGFEQFVANGIKPFTSGRSTFLIGGDIGRSLGDLPIYRASPFGGFLNFSGYTQNSILASDWGIARANYYRRFSEVGSALLGLGFFLGGSIEYGTFSNSNSQVQDMSGVFAGSTFLGIDSPIVPIYFGVGAAEHGERSAYFAVGRLSGRQ